MPRHPSINNRFFMKSLKKLGSAVIVYVEALNR
jgi:hypothetical protein